MEEMNKLIYKDLFETYQQRACPKKWIHGQEKKTSKAITSERKKLS